jgi:ribosome-associated toxin RatA of RatAB toxin-antitoxin module
VPEESTQSITIDADPAAIMAVIADFDHYPTWAVSVKQARVLEQGPDGRARQVEFQLDAGIVRDVYRLRYAWSNDARVEWDLVSGEVMRSQHGSYTLTRQADGTTDVRYSLAVDLAMPMLGQLKRKAERVVMDTALRELKKRVEGLAS